MKVAVVDYGMGNLGSVCKALQQLGAEASIAADPSQLAGSDRAILPGVGSFADGMSRLRERGWDGALRAFAREGRPMLGICLGMQLLADRGTEWGVHEGLGLVPGEVSRLDALGCRERIPHVGWNDIRLSASPGSLFAGIPNGADFYFVHSFAFTPASGDDVSAVVEYGVPFTAAVRRGNVFGTQFHPEKSSRAGARVLRNFLGHAPC